MTNGITFNGIKKDYLTVLENGAPFFAPRTNTLIEVPGRPGAIYDGFETGILTIPLRAMIDAEGSGMSLERLAEDLAGWLNVDQPAPLILDSNPNRIYYALIDGTVDPERVVQYAKFDLTFICPDPFKYSTESMADIKAGQPVRVRGNAPSSPIFEIQLAAPATYLAVGDGKEINMVGTPTDVDSPAYIREERVMTDRMETLTGWGATTTEEENGVITGKIETDGKVFRPSSFGTGTVWHGPALKRPIGASLQDFKIEITAAMVGLKGRVGAAHVLLLDAANNIVGKVNILKNSIHDDGVWVMVRCGTNINGRYVLRAQGENNWRWLFFDGKITVERVGQYWTASAIRYTKERGWHAGMERTVRNRGTYGTAPITQVQVNFWAHSTRPTPTTINVSDLKVYKINEKPDAIPYIGEAGDVFEFDHKEGEIRKNGIPFNREKAFIGKYFDLSPGEQFVVADPDDAIQSAVARWSDRWR